MFRTCSTVTLSARLLWCEWLEALGTHQVHQQSNCGCCTWTENHEQYASCSARSTKVSLKNARFVVTGSRPLSNEQQLVYWTRSFGVYRPVFRYAISCSFTCLKTRLIGVILAAGEWKSSAFLRYCQVEEISVSAVLEVVCAEDED